MSARVLYGIVAPERIMDEILLLIALLVPATPLAQKIPIDFSSAGYGAGAPLPAVAAVVRVKPCRRRPLLATNRSRPIQSGRALDFV